MSAQAVLARIMKPVPALLMIFSVTARQVGLERLAQLVRKTSVFRYKHI